MGFSLCFTLFLAENEGCDEGRHRQGDDPNQHAGVAGGGGTCAVIIGQEALVGAAAELHSVLAQRIVGAVVVGFPNAAVHLGTAAHAVGGVKVQHAVCLRGVGIAGVHIGHSANTLVRAAVGGVDIIGNIIPLIQAAIVADDAGTPFALIWQNPG